MDLSGDEAQYWDWSRQLDWSYYSKGPLVAWIIRASCTVCRALGAFGAGGAGGHDAMPAVRLPALLLAAGTTVVTYLLTRKLFGSERIALGAVLLNHVVPMFAAGSILMTIDPPFFFCWALATYLAALAIFDGRRWAWPAAGAAAGVGFLAKYAMLLWFVPVLLFLWTDPPSRRWLRSPRPWVAVGVALLFTTPVLAWNAAHDWVSVHHVATQTGVDRGGVFSPAGPLRFVEGQAGVVGPGLVVIMAGAVLYAFRPRGEASPHAGAERGAAERRLGFGNSCASRCASRDREGVVPDQKPLPHGRGSPSGSHSGSHSRVTRRSLFPRPPDSGPEPHVRQMRFLAWIGLSLLALTLLSSLRTKVQLNWPAPAYFTLTILAAYFLATRRRERRLWRGWRWWFYPTIAFGLLVLPVVHDPELLYPAAKRLNARTRAARASRRNPRLPRAAGFDAALARLLPASGLDGRKIDFTAKLKGWRELGDTVSDECDRLGPGTFVLCAEYQETAEMAFYVRGQPKTYCIGSYFRHSTRRLTQYDMWPDRSLDPAAGPGGRNPLLGRNAVFVGQFDKAPPELLEAFDSVFEPANDGAAAKRVLAESRRATPFNVWRGGLKVQSFRLIRCYGFRGLKRPAARPAF